MSYGDLIKNLNTNKNNGFNSHNLLKTADLITPVRVVSIVLDESHPRFQDLGGWNALGTIEYELIKNPNQLKEFPLAFPLTPNVKNYPLINETVYLISLPNTLIGESNVSQRPYYINIVGLWNHPHHNAYPSVSNEPPSPQQKDYIQTQVGSAKVVTNEAKQIFLGKTFVERPNIHPLLPFEGDFIQEGRWGNSIRLGSTVGSTPNNWSAVGTNGDPITIIRNGQGKQTNEGWIPITEDINNDDSSIYLTSTQKIPLKTASTSYLSYQESGLDAPTTPNEYEGKQIVLNSGRLVFNSNVDHILFSSIKSINLNSKETITADTRKFIIKSDKIFLGPEDLAKEPLLKGDATVKALKELSSCVRSLVITLQTLTSAPVAPFTPALFPQLLGPMTSLTVNLNTIDQQLNNLTSKNNYTT
jgi:hypothetical protein